MATVVFDIDGVLAMEPPTVNWYERYPECPPNPDAIEVVNTLMDDGHEVVLHTARWEEDREVTVEWLKEHGVRYTALVMGKPFGVVYVDDKALHYEGDSAVSGEQLLAAIRQRIGE